MALKSVYLPDPAFEGDTLRVRGDEHRHLSVGRIERNEAVEIFDGKGAIWAARVASHTRNETLVRVTQKHTVPPDPWEIVLGLSLIRPAAFELALEKVVEVGVTTIIPVIAQRSNVPPGDRRSRWLRIIVEAAKQSKRYHVPMLEEPKSFAGLLALQARTKIVLAGSEGTPLRQALSGSPVMYLVGPEGGWTERELEDARNAAFAPISLGKGILKAETAAIVGAALIRYELQSL